MIACWASSRDTAGDTADGTLSARQCSGGSRGSASSWPCSV